MNNQPTRIARDARRLSQGLTLLFIVVAVTVLAERLGYAGAYATAPRPAAIAHQLLLALPTLIYLAALWQLRRGVAAVARGELFGRTVARTLRHVGWLLVAGAALTILAMPTLHRWLGESYPRLIDFDIATLVLGAIGVALAFFARLLEQAGLVQQELDEMF